MTTVEPGYRAMRWMFMGLVLLGLAAGALTPRGAAAGGPYAGKVIDAETKQPLVGAVVLVYWNREAPGIGHGPAEGFLDAEEVLTSASGEFVVGENPPRTWIPGTWVSWPYITIFYPGYGFFPDSHRSPPRPPTGYKGLLKMMEREEVLFELPQLQTREERLNVVRTVNPLVVPKDKMPNFIRLLNKERRNLHLSPLYGEK